MGHSFKVGDKFKVKGVVFVVQEVGIYFIKAYRRDNPDIIVYFEEHIDGWRSMRPHEILNRVYQNNQQQHIHKPTPSTFKRSSNTLSSITPFTLPEMTNEIYSNLKTEELTPDLIVNRNTYNIYNQIWNKKLKDMSHNLVKLKPSGMSARNYYHLIKDLQHLDYNDDDIEDILKNPSQELLDNAMVEGFINILRWASTYHNIYPNKTNQSDVIYDENLYMIKWLARNAGFKFDKEDIELANPLIRNWFHKHPEYIESDDYWF